MHAVVRRYQVGSRVIDEVIQRRSDVEQLLRGVPGFIAYYAVKTDDGGMTITICEDQAGTAESVRVAAEWVRQNVQGAGSPPEVTEGEVGLHFAQ